MQPCSLEELLGDYEGSKLKESTPKADDAIEMADTHIPLIILTVMVPRATYTPWCGH
jgi:hypothetical protein